MMEDKDKTFKINGTYLFKYDFKTVWEYFKDIRVGAKALEDSEDLQFTKGDKSYDVGSEFNFIHNKLMRVFCKTTFYEETEHYAKTELSCKTEVLADKLIKLHPYIMSYELHKVTLDNTCLMVWEFQTKAQMSEEEATELESGRDKFMEAVEEKIKAIGQKSIQFETIVINVDAKIVWSVISNFKTFCRLVPKICDKVEYPGVTISVGMQVVLKWFKSPESNSSRESQENDTKSDSHLDMIAQGMDNSIVASHTNSSGQSNNSNSNTTQTYEEVVKLKITNITEDVDNYILVYECPGSNKVPSQVIEWKVINIGNNASYITFHHEFAEVINGEAINSVMNMKKQILKDLKLVLETKVKL